MAINFPVPTTLLQEHPDPTSGIIYVWEGTVAPDPVAGFWKVKSSEGGSGSLPGSGGNANIYVGPTPPLVPGDNQLWWNSEIGRMFLYYADGDTNQWVETSPGVSSPDAIPVGMILPHGTTDVPAGFIECDGRALSRTTYSNLFTAIGTKWGIGDGLNTFNVPDLRGEFLRGWDHNRFVDNVGTYAGTKTNASAMINGLTIPSALLESGMLVTGTGIPANSVIDSFTIVAGVTSSITLNNIVSGSGAVTIDIFGRKFGSAEDDMLESHTHDIGTASDTDNSGTGLFGAGNTNTAISGSMGGAETRPRNQAVMYVIKAFATYTNPGLIDIADLAADVTALQNAVWVSPLQPITQTAVNVITTPKVTLTHGLGVTPKKVYGQLICKAPFLHYQAGDRLPIYDYITDEQIQGLKLQWNASTITYQLCGHGFVVWNMDGVWNDYRSCFNTMLVNYFDFVIIAET